MRKIKSKVLLLMATILLSSIFIFSGCGGNFGGSTGGGNYNGGYTPSHTHSYDKEVVADQYLCVPVSCTTPAYYYKSCSCGKKGEYTFSYGEPLGHNYVDKPGLEPTCIDSGYTEYKECSRCEHIIDQIYIAPLWHEYVDGVCTRCDHVKTTSTTDLKYFNFTLIDNKGTPLEHDDEYEISLKNEYINELYNEVPEEIVIPSRINYEYNMGTVTSIADNGFASYRIKDITIPDSVKSIGMNAFIHAGLNATITVPSGVNLCYRSFYGSQFKSVILNDGIEEIPNECFYNCTNLSNVTMPDSVKYIGDKAFAGCKNLKNITNPSHADKIITLSNNLSRVAKNAFSDSNPELYDEKDGVLYVDTWAVGVKDKTTLEKVEIKDGTVGLSDELFYINNNDYLQETNLKCSIKSVYLPSSVKYIGYSAFADCERLIRVDGGIGLLYFSDYAFENCTSLTSIVLYEKVKSLGSYTFYGCKQLTSLSIMGDELMFGGESFAYCPISSISVNPNHVQFCVENNCLIDYGNGTIVIGNRTGIIPDACEHVLTCENGMRSIAKIGEYAFSGRVTFSSINIPESIFIIDEYAFADCKNLETVVLPTSTGDNKYRINEGAFYKCSKLKNINFPDNLYEIGYQAFAYSGFTSIDLTNICHQKNMYMAGQVFAYCENLEEVTITLEQRYLPALTFNECSKLTKINYLGTIEQWNKITKYNQWDYRTADYIVYCSDGNLTKEEVNA